MRRTARSTLIILAIALSMLAFATLLHYYDNSGFVELWREDNTGAATIACGFINDKLYVASSYGESSMVSRIVDPLNGELINSRLYTDTGVIISCSILDENYIGIIYYRSNLTIPRIHKLLIINASSLEAVRTLDIPPSPPGFHGGVSISGSCHRLHSGATYFDNHKAMVAVWKYDFPSRFIYGVNATQTGSTLRIDVVVKDVVSLKTYKNITIQLSFGKYNFTIVKSSELDAELVDKDLLRVTVPVRIDMDSLKRILEDSIVGWIPDLWPWEWPPEITLNIYINTTTSNIEEILYGRLYKEEYPEPVETVMKELGIPIGPSNYHVVEMNDFTYVVFDPKAVYYNPYPGSLLAVIDNNRLVNIKLLSETSCGIIASRDLGVIVLNYYNTFTVYKLEKPVPLPTSLAITLSYHNLYKTLDKILLATAMILAAFLLIIPKYMSSKETP